MDDLRRAIEVTERMKSALAIEVARAREQRLLIRKLDSDGLTERAQRRDQFNRTMAELQAALARHLEAAATALGLREVTTEQIRARAPREGHKLTEVLGQIRGLAGALKELDELNRRLAERALGFVRGYMHSLTAQPTAYDRRGLATAGIALRPGATARC
jgi:hypothetical protein